MILRLHRSTLLRGATMVALTLVAGLTQADNSGDNRQVRARLGGFQEVPVVSTTGNGEFRGKIDGQTGEVDYEISFSDMQGTVVMAHIHLGQRGVNGGIMVWLCQSTTNPAPATVAATTPMCTSPAFAHSGRITAISLVGPGGAQQLGAGELAELGAALRAGVAYVNVHTNLSPAGEIRGQISSGHHH